MALTWSGRLCFLDPYGGSVLGVHCCGLVLSIRIVNGSKSISSAGCDSTVSDNLKREFVEVVYEFVAVADHFK